MLLVCIGASCCAWASGKHLVSGMTAPTTANSMLPQGLHRRPHHVCCRSEACLQTEQMSRQTMVYRSGAGKKETKRQAAMPAWMKAKCQLFQQWAKLAHDVRKGLVPRLCLLEEECTALINGSASKACHFSSILELHADSTLSCWGHAKQRPSCTAGILQEKALSIPCTLWHVQRPSCP